MIRLDMEKLYPKKKKVDSEKFAIPEQLPDELLFQLLLEVGTYKDVMRLCATSFRIREFCKDRIVWKRLFEKNFKEYMNFYTKIGFDEWKQAYEHRFYMSKKKKSKENKDLRKQALFRETQSERWRERKDEKVCTLLNGKIQSITYKGFGLKNILKNVSLILRDCMDFVGSVKKQRTWIGYLNKYGVFLAYAKFSIGEEKHLICVFFSVHESGIGKIFKVMSFDAFRQFYSSFNPPFEIVSFSRTEFQHSKAYLKCAGWDIVDVIFDYNRKYK